MSDSYPAEASPAFRAILDSSSPDGTLEEFFVRVAGLHREHGLVILLRRIIWEDLDDLLRWKPNLICSAAQVHDWIYVLRALGHAIETAAVYRTELRWLWPSCLWCTAENDRQTGPRRRRIERPTRIEKLPNSAPSPDRKREEKEHFLGGGNIRRPSQN